MNRLRYSHILEATADDAADDFEMAAREVGEATDGSGLYQVTVEGSPAAALVPLDLVEHALRHGWSR